MAAGGIIYSTSQDFPQLIFGGLTIIIGSVTTIVGIPILITGSSRVKKINNLERNSHSGFNMNLKSDIQYNQFTQNYQPGLTLSISF